MAEEEKRGLWKRTPAVEKSISEIQDSDTRIRILGTIIDLTDGSLLIDDGSGKMEIMFDSNEHLLGLKPRQLIRVVTRIMPLIEGYACKGECVQTLDGFDLESYKKAKKIVSG
ncbi:MAG: hypothetical protein ISS95_00270 [Candidatus Aenigmarchaeota archaeon]|nr:hypothetical protein [Candidatus Aenigmarchaeota archaeon]